MGTLPRIMGAPLSASREMLGNRYPRVISQPMADPMAISCSTAVTGHVAKHSWLYATEMRWSAPSLMVLPHRKLKEKPTEIREPKDALYERAAELVSALRGLESHHKQGQVPCKHYAGIQIGLAVQSFSQRGHDGV